MHPRILAQREAEASARTVAAANKLAIRFGLEEEAKALKAEEKQPEVQQMVRNEAVADLLEKVVNGVAGLPSDEDLQAATDEIITTTEALLLARIEVISGIGPKTMEIIREGLEGSSVEATIEVVADVVGPVTVETVETVIVPPVTTDTEPSK